MRSSVAILAGFGLLMITSGCSQNMGAVRGQNAGPFQMASGGGHRFAGPSPGPMYYDGPSYDVNQGGAPNCPSCPTAMHGVNCPSCPPGMHGGSSCPACPQGHGFDVWRPTHHHTWEYNAPKGLSYPSPNQPPGVIQYPYYTVKGPSDFFYQ